MSKRAPGSGRGLSFARLLAGEILDDDDEDVVAERIMFGIANNCEELSRA
jgi:hypothetical protein